MRGYFGSTNGAAAPCPPRVRSPLAISMPTQPYDSVSSLRSVKVREMALAALHGSAASLRVENASKGTLHVVFDETQLPALIMHLEDGASLLPH